ncbi:MAG: hypothetical protein KF778_01030 [Rhodocyclaceae bacterium]|nr:hypothetical protein [Rhodocyclaceae bacterium]MBX3666963.1 hypothetical protein [Rhodocyclaceae bacterium]
MLAEACASRAAHTSLAPQIPTDAEHSRGPWFFATAPHTLALLSLATANTYIVYWFYRNWRSLPGTRLGRGAALFAALCYPVSAPLLFRHVAAAGGRPPMWRVCASSLALLWLATYLPQPWWLLSGLSFLPLLPVQAAINRLQTGRAVLHEGFTAGSLIALLAGACLWAAALMGLAGAALS